MIDWTDDAHRAFDEYALKTRARLRAAGADPEEVLIDLRGHIEQSASERGLSLLTGADVRQMLAGMGEPEPASPPLEASDDRAEVVSSARAKTLRLWLGGVVLPTIALVFQGLTGMCSTVLEPMPTWLHAVLIATVPCATALGLYELKHGPSPRHALISLFVGFALGIAVIYATLFLPLLPLTLIFLFMGLGLLGLSPLLSVLTLLSLLRRLREIAALDARPMARRGVALGVLALLLVELPSFVTGIGLHLADSPSPTHERTGLWILRHLGHEPTMRASAQRRSFEEGALEASLLLFPARMLDPVSTNRAREIYFRATGGTVDGKPLLTRNERPLALAMTRSGWDEDLGSDRVGGVLDDLALASSRLDVHVEPENSVAYMEWTQEFLNSGIDRRESRAQWLLPEGAVVSRVTLWIEGEPREAAFGATAQVRRAYQEVAVQQRRDPLLVTWSGPNTVLVQAFPVLPKVPMRIRIGITAPLQLDRDKHGSLTLPKLVEANYGAASKLRHHVWVESSAALRAATGALVSASSGKGFALRGELSDADLRAGMQVDAGALDVSITRTAPAALPGACPKESPCEAEPLVVTQRWVERAQGGPENLAIVLDGSAALAEQRNAIAELVEKIGADTRIRLWLAADEPVSLLTTDALATQEKKALAARVRHAEMIGGMDNAPALIAALDWLEGKPDAQLLWIHGPQGVELPSRSGVEQRIERSTSHPRWLSLQLAQGPNRLLQALAPSASISSLQGAAGLARLASLLSGSSTWTIERTGQSTSEASATTAAGNHMVRLWARDLIAARTLDPARETKLAIQQQLVTQVSGAVVLERAEQYERHDLEPVDPTSVPSIPEPHIVLLLLVVALMLAAQQWRERRLS
jgi:hypothetical protein